MAHGPRILLIDDDPLWLESLADYFKGKGFRVRTANRAALGLAMVERHTIELVIVDAHMPNAEGIDVLQCLRRERPAISVVMVSGDDESGLRHRALQGGAKGFVSKTASPTVMLATIRRVLAQMQEGSTDKAIERSWKRLLPILRQSRWYLPVLVPDRKPVDQF